ncbi:MAG: type II secretion system minor pseudopilin GspI [Steroidobacterales bacterium]
MKARFSGGFTLIEVLVALAVVAMGLAALMTAVSGTASASGYLREKTQAQWIALNRLVEVRMNLQKFGANTDAGELDFANRHWHYDTRYFDTSIPTMRRVVVRVWAGSADTKSNPLAESTGFLGTALTSPGSSNAVDWTQGSTAPAQAATTPGTQNGKGLGALLPGAGNAAGSASAAPGLGGSGSLGGAGSVGSDLLGGDSSGNDTSGDNTGSGGQLGGGTTGGGAGNDLPGTSP